MSKRLLRDKTVYPRVMPEGIVPELIIAAAFLVIVIGVVVVARRKPPAGRGPSTAADVEALQRATEAPARAHERAETKVDVEAQPAPIVVERPGLRDRLTKSRRFLSQRLSEALGRAPDAETWDDVEAALIQADVGVQAATKIVQDLKDISRERGIATADEVRSLLAEELVQRFDAEADRSLQLSDDGVTVWLIVGVNGTGKTTTIGKLAHDLRLRGRSVALAAADTFRAAADEQLQVWADRSAATLIKHQPGADPGAVAFDAFAHARAKNMDVLIVDTAGRLHTKTSLMDELAKIRRVIEKEGSVQEALLVIDATAGQNGLAQAREFAQAIGVSGVVLTKLDGTAKGGIAIAIEETLDIPIKLIGVGESLDDLEPFNPKTYVDALLD
jgi:fused signal recognition particle receptor